jgi:hypothetical protein
MSEGRRKAFTHVVTSRTPYALDPPRDMVEAEPTPISGFLEAGTKVELLETLDNLNGFSEYTSASFYRVRTKGGIVAYIQTDSVRSLG